MSHAPTSARRLIALAAPALVVLAAEPLYILVDTAVVGHLGSTSLAALAIGGTVMAATAWFGTALAYGTTARAARRFGAGERAAAVAEGVQASWLALTLGALLAAVGQVAAAPVATAMAGGDPEVARRRCRLAADRAARRPRPAAGHRRPRLAARGPGLPPAAAVRDRRERACPRCSARCSSTRPGWG